MKTLKGGAHGQALKVLDFQPLSPSVRRCKSWSWDFCLPGQITKNFGNDSKKKSGLALNIKGHITLDWAI